MIGGSFLSRLLACDYSGKHRSGFRKIYLATPGLYRAPRSPAIVKMGYVKILNQAPQMGVAQAARPSPLGVLLLTNSTLEVYEELVDKETPFDLVARYNLKSDLGGADLKVHPSTVQKSELLKLQLSAPADTPVWFDHGDMDVLLDWKVAIEKAMLEADVGLKGLDDAAEEEEDGDEEDDNKVVDAIIEQQVRRWLERAIIGPHLSLLMRSAEPSCELLPAAVDDALSRARSQTQDAAVFAIPERDRDESNWKEAIEALDRMTAACTPLLPAELVEQFLSAIEAIYCSHSSRHEHDLGPESYLAILTWCFSQTSTEHLAEKFELMRQFATTQAERQELQAASAALQNLIRNDTNEMFNDQIKDDMAAHIIDHPGAGLGDWAKVSDWARDTGGERDANGAPIRALDGIWAQLWEGAQARQLPRAVGGLRSTSSAEELLLERFEQERKVRRTRLDSVWTPILSSPRALLEAAPEPEPQVEQALLEPEPEPQEHPQLARTESRIPVPGDGTLTCELLFASGLLPADYGNVSDPFVIIKVGAAEAQSATKEKTLQPGTPLSLQRHVRMQPSVPHSRLTAVLVARSVQRDAHAAHLLGRDVERCLAAHPRGVGREQGYRERFPRRGVGAPAGGVRVGGRLGRGRGPEPGGPARPEAPVRQEHGEGGAEADRGRQHHAARGCRAQALVYAQLKLAA